MSIVLGYTKKKSFGIPGQKILGLGLGLGVWVF